MRFTGIRRVISRIQRPQTFFYELYKNEKGIDVVAEAAEFSHHCYIQEVRIGNELVPSISGGDWNRIELKIYTTHKIIPPTEGRNFKIFLIKNNSKFLINSIKSYDGVYYLYRANYVGDTR